ncbi:MAG: DUF805 domain-containing protein [Prevotellaceae bacterium]|jgi:uncharacterized membrane protein YhaH (DUF805 family)|nr:DUF805 domain-containing protein [Prevotellaceae bacterium]
MEYYLKALRHYADFSGRASRKEYWMFVLFNFIFLVGAAVVSVILGMILFGSGSRQAPLVRYFGINFCLLYYIAVAVPFLAITVRRLHDSGKSGWWLLPGVLLAISNIVVADTVSQPDLRNTLIAVISVLLFVYSISMLVFMLLDSDSNKNRYGSHPAKVKIYGERARTKSLGIAFIAAASLSILSLFLAQIELHLNYQMPLGDFGYIFHTFINNINIFVILFVGILLLQKRDRTKSIGISLIVLAGISFVNFIKSLINFSNLLGMMNDDTMRVNVDIPLYIVNLLGTAVFIAAMLTAGIVWMQRNNQEKTVKPQIAVNCLVAASLVGMITFVLTLISYVRMLSESVFLFHALTIVWSAVLLVLATSLLPQNEDTPSQTEEDDETYYAKPISSGKIDLWQKIFAIVNIVIGVLFTFSCIINMFQNHPNYGVILMIMLVSLFMWISGAFYLYLVKRNESNKIIQILNIVSAVISCILILFLLAGIIATIFNLA